MLGMYILRKVEKKKNFYGFTFESLFLFVWLLVLHNSQKAFCLPVSEVFVFFSLIGIACGYILIMHVCDLFFSWDWVSRDLDLVLGLNKFSVCF